MNTHEDRSSSQAVGALSSVALSLNCKLQSLTLSSPPLLKRVSFLLLEQGLRIFLSVSFFSLFVTHFQAETHRRKEEFSTCLSLCSL